MRAATCAQLISTQTTSFWCRSLLLNKQLEARVRMKTALKTLSFSLLAPALLLSLLVGCDSSTVEPGRRRNSISSSIVPHAAIG